MSEVGRQLKLLAFAGHHEVPDKVALGVVIREELLALRETLGRGIIAISGAATAADLVFLRACVELRIPTIIFLPFSEDDLSNVLEDKAEQELAQHLMGVALTKHISPTGNLVEWADVLLFASDGPPIGEIAQDACDLGIPTLLINPTTLETGWTIPPNASSRARHGFETRQDLLNFLEGRFSGNR